ncbi:MAG: acyl-CoA thioesterase [Candidatus Marsarchaeota archaeon]|nr:acyl-CoA thioesterase [Candidatus Marsarchaeota archaeon]
MKNKTFVWNERVRIYDTDAQGVVHYAGYYRFFTDAFEQFSKTFLNSEFPMISEKVWFVVVESRAEYHTPAHLGDILHTYVNAEVLGQKAIRFSFKIHKGRSVVCDGYIVQVAIDSKKWKAVPVPQYIVEKIRVLEKHK